MTSVALSTSSSFPFAHTIRRAVERLSVPTDPDAVLIAEVPAPVSSAEALLRLVPSEDCSYWADPDGSEQVGLGALVTLTSSGSGRFGNVAEQARALFARLPAASRVRLFGGFAFQTGRAVSADWSPFGEARFVLPRLVYERSGEAARLLLLFSASELQQAVLREQRIELALAAFGLLTTGAEPNSAVAISGTLQERADAVFTDAIPLIRAAIERGELEKVVLARRVGLSLSAAPDLTRVLRRLAQSAPECVRFAFRTAGSTFLGATPERLIEKREMRFRTDAVAGSIRVGDVSPGRLLESQKDRAEQAIVVRELVRSLEPIAASLEYPSVPEIHQLRHVAHLRTPISGTLRHPLHVLDLVARVHPTPATGGVPTERALDFIVTHEPDERGWYAGPIGWFDAAGDGAFAVALRSGLIAGQRGALYAGAGIVQGSEPVNELAETRWKLAALLGAFEVGP